VGFVRRLSPLVKIIVMKREVFCGADQGKLRDLRRSINWGDAGFMASCSTHLQTEEHLLVAEVLKETWTPSRASGMLRSEFV
jgi:hypothetical protein